MLKIKSKKEFEDILKENGDKTVVLKFGAEWCGPCRLMENIIANIEKNPENNAVFVSCDVDEADETDPDFLTENSVRNVPLTLVYNDEMIADRIVGALSEKELMEKIS